MDIYFVVSDNKKCMIEKTLDDGIVVLEDGLIEINITSEDTDLPVSYFKCEVVLIDVEDKRYTVYQGGFEVKRSYAKEC